MKQHYIPRCYLKQFSDNPKSVYTYDKVSSKAYLASLMSVCCEDDIYSLSDSYVEESNNQNGGHLNKLSIEQEHFAHFVEPEFSKLLKELDVIKDEWMTAKEHYRLTFLEKKEIALHLVTQFFRLPEIREYVVNDYIRMDKANIDIIKHFLAMQHKDKSFEDLKIDIECEEPALHADLTYLNNDMLMMFAEAIAHNIWIFQVSRNADFYTSDFPIVVKPHVLNVRPMYMGLAQYGGELTYPLSPRILLTVYDREYFNSLGGNDCMFIEATDKEVRRQNMLRYFYAKRHVFSLHNDYRLIDRIYANEGHHIFCNCNLKTEIISGFGRY